MIFGVNTSPMAGRKVARHLAKPARPARSRASGQRVASRGGHGYAGAGEGGRPRRAAALHPHRDDAEEGYEIQVSRPDIVTRDVDGVKMEPVEDLVIDIPDEFQGVVIAQAGTRRGVPMKMVNHGSGRVDWNSEFRREASSASGRSSLPIPKGPAS